MSKQWDKQKKSIDTFNNNARVMAGIEPSPFTNDVTSRWSNQIRSESVKKANASQRGNPLSIVANEEKPNPARRMKMMRAAKNNAKS
jgi:hypothetical protein